MRVNMSATGSLCIVFSPQLKKLARFYQLAFTTPGISPFNARERKQIRHKRNLRINAFDRPHKGQRLCARTLNLAFRVAATIFDVFAITVVLFLCLHHCPLD